MPVIDRIKDFQNDLVAIRRDIHAHPEIGFEETRTSAIVAELKKQIPYYALRFQVKPGLTGWAQVNYRYGASVDDTRVKLSYDLFYVQERSVPLYLLTLVKTVTTVLFKPGS